MKGRAASLDVVAFGEVLWDIFELDAPRDPARRRFERLLGGSPANVATVIARLGATCAIVGGIGKDRFGQALEEHLANDGVETRHLVRLPNRTGVTFISRDARGEPAFLFYRHESADVSIAARHVTPKMGKARWVHLGTSTMMTPELARATRRFLRIAMAAGASVSLDLNVRAHLWPSKAALRRAAEELLAVSHLVKASEADLVELGVSESWCQERSRDAVFAVTRSAKAATVRFGVGARDFVQATPKPVRVVDATGAGDAFIGGILASLSAARVTRASDAFRSREFWKVALDVANSVGRRAVSEVGAVTAITDLARERKLLHSLAREH